MISVNIGLESSLATMSDFLKEKLASKKIVFLCIGSQRVTGDSLGPYVGTKVTNNLIKPAFVYGMVGSNVNALNLKFATDFVKALHPEHTIIVVDSAVGSKEEVGCVQIFEGGLMPGAATNKNLPKIGDISILGVVSERGINDYFQLEQTKQSLINEMSDFIANCINISIS